MGDLAQSTVTFMYTLLFCTRLQNTLGHICPVALNVMSRKKNQTSIEIHFGRKPFVTIAFSIAIKNHEFYMSFVRISPRKGNFKHILVSRALIHLFPSALNSPLKRDQE
jgi:hypothetical protein